MKNILKFFITADDNSGPGFKSFKSRFKKAADDARKQARSAHAWKRVQESNLGDPKFDLKLGQAMSATSDQFFSYAKGAGAAAAETAAIGGAMILATKAAWDFASPFLKGSNELLRTSRIIGVSAQDLQHYRTAAELAGLSSDDMTSSLTSLGKKMRDAVYGGDVNAQAMFATLGIRIKDVNGKLRSTKDVMLDLADAMKNRGSPQTRAAIASQLGVEGILPMLLDGRVALQKQIAEAAAVNPGMTDEQLKQLNKMNEDTLRLSQNWNKLKLNISEHIIIPWLDPAIKQLDTLVTQIGKGDAGGVVQTMAGGAWRGLRNYSAPGWIASSVFGKDTPVSPDTISQYFRGKGYSEAAIGGIVSGMYGESKLNSGAKNPFSGATGLGQWLGPRKKDFAAKFGHGLDASTVNEQLDFVDWELNNKERTAGDAIRGARTPEEAANAYITKYMRPAAGHETDSDLRRAAEFRAQNHSVDVNVTLGGAVPMGTVAQIQASPQARTGLTIATPELGAASQW